MRRRVKRILAAAAITVILSGCGNAETAAQEEIPVSAEEETAVEEMSTAEEASDGEEEISPEEGASAAAGSASVVFDELITVGVVNSDPGESGHHFAVDEEMKAAFTEENGYSASFVYRDESGAQIEAAGQFIQNGVDYLLLSVSDAADWNSVLMDAQDAGVRVILFDHAIGVDESLYEAVIISDMEKEGEDAVNWLANQGLNEYNIIHLQDRVGSAEQKGRTKALNERAAADDSWKIVARRPADGSADQAQKVVQSVIDSGEAFNVIYAENDDMAKGAVAALDEAEISHGVGGKVIVIGFGGNKWALQELLSQNWNYDGQCSPFQASYIDSVIKTIESGGSLAEKVIVMDEKGFDATTITAEDIELYGI